MTATTKKRLGTGPVFFTAISTILGAILFLRFGYAVGQVGFFGTVMIIIIGHIVTITTAMSIAEIATNQKVEGGGEYHIISRSFGINIGAAIGIALFMSQSISVAFYVIAFAEAFKPLFAYLAETYGLNVPSDPRLVSIPSTILLSLLILARGANIGLRVLYVVVTILFISLIMFFIGKSDYQSSGFTPNLFTGEGTVPFFIVFAIVFPAFTGMTAGVGLSGDLKNPSKSIPYGTLTATILGMIIYIIIAYKLCISAPSSVLADPANQLFMSNIAIWGPIIPIGLAAATFSSAIGSILVAPRTLQALAKDRIFALPHINRWIAKGNGETHEPRNATLITCAIAIVFVAMGDVNVVAQLISMFFMVTYGSLCLISFLQHFAADPSYRPAFRSRWYISLTGALMCIFLMFKMNPTYAISAIIVMVLMYLIINHYNPDKAGMSKIFQGVAFQTLRQIQIFVQKAEKTDEDDTWRPNIVAMSSETFKRTGAFDVTRFIAHQYGFGSYFHFERKYFSAETALEAKKQLHEIIHMAEVSKSKVYVDTVVTNSFTQAVMHIIQSPSVSGKETNMFLMEYFKDDVSGLEEIIDNYSLIRSAGLDICVLASSQRGFSLCHEIHIWLTPETNESANLMILLSYMIASHPQWKKSDIKIFALFPFDELKDLRNNLYALIQNGRLPISIHNVEVISKKPDMRNREIINSYSKNADLTIIGMNTDAVKQLGTDYFEGYNEINNILFVNAVTQKVILKDI